MSPLQVILLERHSGRQITEKYNQTTTTKERCLLSVYKRGKLYWMDDVVYGIRYRLPLKTKNWQEALRREKEELTAITQGKKGNNGRAGLHTLDEALDAYIESRRLFSAPKTYVTDRERSGSLRKALGNVRLKRVTAEMIAEYQTQRMAKGVSGRTVNLEVGLLRRVLKRNRQWARLADDIQMLPERPKEARVLLPEEKADLLRTAALKPQWMVAHCAAILALNTTMRGCELKGLRWKNVDLFERTVMVRRQTTKTDAGWRVIPLNRDAVMALSELRTRAEKIGSADPEHYVFPACQNGHIDPNKPMKTWRTAWRSLTKAAGLKGFRFHDLRHHCVTELSEGGHSDQVIMSIAGHVSREMLEHYSHIRLAAKRRALEALETPLQEVAEGSEDKPFARVN
jgi:integrase